LSELRLAYETDSAALELLVSRARHLGVRFPASFVEWYGMRDGIALLRQHSNCDEPIDIAKLGNSTSPLSNKGGQRSLPTHMMPFMVENQSCCIWAIPLDAGDDPPVFVAIEHETEWRPYAATFSTFVACQIWDHPTGRILLQAQAIPLAPFDLEVLRRGFHEKATTHNWPTTQTFRFEREDARVLISTDERQADWWLTARSEETLAALARDLWMCGDLKTSLWAIDDPGVRALAAVRPSE
jgi:hypothetical protein